MSICFTVNGVFAGLTVGACQSLFLLSVRDGGSAKAQQVISQFIPTDGALDSCEWSFHIISYSIITNIILLFLLDILWGIGKHLWYDIIISCIL